MIYSNVQGKDLTLHKINRNDSFSGIYIFINSKNEKVYIGSSVNVRRRTKEHLRELENKSHANIHLQRVFDICPENLNVYLLERVINKENLLEREQFWMDSFNSYERESGYNMVVTAGSTKGYKASDETKMKISIASKNRSKESLKKVAESNSIPIVQLDMSGNLIEIYKSSKEASSILGYRSTSISSCCTGNIMTSRGFIWEHLDTYLDEEYYHKWRLIVKKVIQIDRNGEIVKLHESVSDAVKSVQIPNNSANNSIIKCCNDESNNYKGYMWMWFDDYFYENKEIPIYNSCKKSIFQYDFDLNVIKAWDSAFQASKELNISHSGIYKNLKGASEFCSGYIWKYA